MGDDRAPKREPLGLIDRSPMYRMAPPKLDDVPVPLLTAEQIDDLWHLTERPGRNFFARRDAAIIWMFLATGIRAGEMAGLELSNLDLNAQVAFVGGKGRRYRNVPYSGAAATALDRYRAARSQNKFADRTKRLWL